MPVKINWGAATDVGKRRAGNEDALLVDADRMLFAVADGMGGHNAGEVASATAIEALRATYKDPPHLSDAVKEANDAVIQKAATEAGYENMGTTLTAVAVDGDTATISHVGDSRAYLLRDGELTQVTDDHSWVEQLVREGKLTPEEAEVHPQRSIVTRALGIEANVTVDNDSVDLAPGDRVLICSDGLTSMVREPEIAATLRRDSNPQRAADGLVAAANKAGGEDNITVIVLDVRAEGGGRSSRAPSGAPADTAGGAATGHWEDTDHHDTAQETPSAHAAEPTPKRRSRRTVMRALAVGLPVVLVIAAAVGTLGWYARRTFFVGPRAGVVVLYRGVPGGLLGWQPTVERRYPIHVRDLEPADQDDVRRNHKFSSKAAANRYVLLIASRAIAGPTATSPTTAPAGPPVNTVPTNTGTTG